MAHSQETGSVSQLFSMRLRARELDLEPVCELPYGPAALNGRIEGRTEVSTRLRACTLNFLLALKGASTEENKLGLERHKRYKNLSISGSAAPKDFLKLLHVLAGAVMCPAFCAAFACAAGHNAFRASQVPIESPHSKCSDPKWVFLSRRFRPALCIHSCPPSPTSKTLHFRAYFYRAAAPVIAGSR